jgi:hypothetical protein
MTRQKDILTPSFRDPSSTSPYLQLVVVAYDSDFCQDVVAQMCVSPKTQKLPIDSHRSIPSMGTASPLTPPLKGMGTCEICVTLECNSSNYCEHSWVFDKSRVRLINQ